MRIPRQYAIVRARLPPRKTPEDPRRVFLRPVVKGGHIYAMRFFVMQQSNVGYIAPCPSTINSPES